MLHTPGKHHTRSLIHSVLSHRCKGARDCLLEASRFFSSSKGVYKPPAKCDSSPCASVQTSRWSLPLTFEYSTYNNDSQQYSAWAATIWMFGRRDFVFRRIGLHSSCRLDSKHLYYCLTTTIFEGALQRLGCVLDRGLPFMRKTLDRGFDSHYHLYR